MDQMETHVHLTYLQLASWWSSLFVPLLFNRQGPRRPTDASRSNVKVMSLTANVLTDAYTHACCHGNVATQAMASCRWTLTAAAWRRNSEMTVIFSYNVFWKSVKSSLCQQVAVHVIDFLYTCTRVWSMDRMYETLNVLGGPQILQCFECILNRAGLYILKNSNL